MDESYSKLNASGISTTNTSFKVNPLRLKKSMARVSRGFRKGKGGGGSNLDGGDTDAGWG